MLAKSSIAAIFIFSAGFAMADPAEIVSAKISNSGGSYSVSVTLKHGDTGWDDYADGWRVELEDGQILGTRVLHHPHVNEQPFTRSLSGVSVPESTTKVFIRSRTNKTGWGTKRLSLTLN